MNFKVRYHNKPHDLRLSNTHICPLAKGLRARIRADMADELTGFIALPKALEVE